MGQLNDTTMSPFDTTDMDMDTSYYTTLEQICTLEPIESTNEPDCDLFEAQLTLNEGENMELTICGYEEDGTDFVQITLDLPSDIWLGVGFKKSGEIAAGEKHMKGYVVILPFCERDIEERLLTGYGLVGLGNVLEDSISIVEDTITEETRTIRLKRALTVEGEGYFDFADFLECDDLIEVIYAFSPLPNVQWAPAQSAAHGSNKGYYSQVAPTEVGGEYCSDGGGDAANSLSVLFSLAVSALSAVLFS
jgi:hypothetical protein